MAQKNLRNITQSVDKENRDCQPPTSDATAKAANACGNHDNRQHQKSGSEPHAVGQEQRASRRIELPNDFEL
jgi:hypothetical protein